jgi:uncharacterized protein (DUF983 family)
LKITRCPRCGKGKILKSYLTVAGQCSECGLPLNKHEQGDGPAFFAITIVGTLVAIFATITEVKYEPPFWLHAVLWIPFVVLGSLLCLHYLKAAFIHVQYKTKPQDFD